MPSFIMTESLRPKRMQSKKDRTWLKKQSPEFKRKSFDNLKRQFARARG